jgi:hypothetical protein
MTPLLTDRYRDRLAGVLSCYDRIVITGTLPGACFAEGMTKLLRSRGIRIFDYPTFAAGLRDRVREAAAASGVTIEHIAKSYVRKEAVVAKILLARGDHPGLVHVISAMEACDAYRPWHDKQTHQTFLRPDSGKSLHYYFYFIDAELGLIYLRVPTWCPFRLQFYCNGHSWLARQLAAAGIGFTMADNALAKIDDWPRAQALADTLSPDALHHILDRYAAQCCPVLDVFAHAYHWSLMQVEYSTDLVFHSQATLRPLYQQLTRQAVLSVKPRARRYLPRPQDHTAARPRDRQPVHHPHRGNLIQHGYGSATIKMYDKFALVLRLETTSSDVSAFKHHRKVEHRKGPASRALAPVKKTIYSLNDLRHILFGCNRRYLAFLSALDDFSSGIKTLDRLTQPHRVGDRTIKGFNFFDPLDHALLQALHRPAFNIAGIRRADLAPALAPLSPATFTRKLSRLRQLGLIKRVTRTYRYYLTRVGRAAIAAASRITQFAIIPALA